MPTVITGPGLLSRIAWITDPAWYSSREMCQKMLSSNDPINNVPVLEKIAANFTTPLTNAEINQKVDAAPQIPRLVPADTEANLNILVKTNHWSDKMPIVLPTEERVAAMLKGTSHKADESFTIQGPYESYSFTVEKVAVNAVMAGAKPAYMPTLLALATNGLGGLGQSTSNFAYMTIINGPVRKEIGMNLGSNTMGPVNEANSVIGRFRVFVSLNLLGYADLLRRDSLVASQGNSLDYNSVCVAENEELLPSGWTPLHVQQGFKAEESVVTSFQSRAMYQPWNYVPYGGPPGQNTNVGFITEILEGAQFLAPGSGTCIFVPEYVVKILYNAEGFKTKEAISDYVYNNVKIPLSQYWKYDGPNNSLSQIPRKVEPYYSYSIQPQDTLINMLSSAKQVKIALVGVDTGPFWQMSSDCSASSYAIDKWK